MKVIKRTQFDTQFEIWDAEIKIVEFDNGKVWVKYPVRVGNCMRYNRRYFSGDIAALLKKAADSKNCSITSHTDYSTFNLYHIIYGEVLSGGWKVDDF